MGNLCASRVLVTGADGFIRSHLAEQFVAAGAQARALSLYDSTSAAELAKQAAGISKPVVGEGEEELGWRPRVSLADGIGAVVAAERAARG